jgi:hypothetical protein
MYLTASNLFYYLRDVGLASSSDILDGDYGLSEIGRRNRNFRVTGAGGKAIFVKQVPAVMPETMLSFMREAAFAQLAAEAAPGSALRHVGATLRRYDPRAHVLVYDAIEANECLTEYAQRRGAMPEGIARNLALVLASIHLETMQHGALARVSQAFSGEAPWIFIISTDAETVMPNMSAGVRQVVGLLRQTPELSGSLTELGRQWRRLCLMHGDMKADNVLIALRPDGGRELKLIDWELSNLGDPLWDAACALCLFLQPWLFSVRVDGTVPTAGSIPGDAQALAAAKRNAGLFWTTYLERMRPALPADDDATLRVGRLAAARLVLLVFELLPNATTVSPHAMLALQLARYFFVDPSNALRDLFGIVALANPLPTTAPPPTDIGEPWKLPAEAPHA